MSAQPVDEPARPTITISLSVENRYELYERVDREFISVVIPAPPSFDEDSEAYGVWAYCQIYDVFTGVGHEDGKSWYDVQITACSVPELVGRTFEFGDY